MPKFSIDYQGLSNTMTKKAYKLSDVKDRIQKVAFDVVRFKDGDPEELWQIQSADDGDYIVSLYEQDEAKKAASKSKWNVSINKSGSDLNVFYKGEPIVKVAIAKLGFGENDMNLVKKYLPAKLDSNKNLVKTLIKELDNKSREDLLKKYPELS